MTLGSEQHAHNVDEYPFVSLLVWPLTPRRVSPQACGAPFVQVRGPVTEVTNDPLAERQFMRRFPAAREHMVAPRFFLLEPERVVLGGDTLEQPHNFDRSAFETAKIDPVMTQSRTLLEQVSAVSAGPLASVDRVVFV